MTTLITVLIILASLALVLVVIVQKSKGGGLAASFSGANNIVGVRKATDGIEKATWGLMATIMVLCLIYPAFDKQGVNPSDALNQGIEKQAATSNVPTLPQLGGNQSATPAATATPETTPTATPTEPSTGSAQ